MALKRPSTTDLLWAGTILLLSAGVVASIVQSLHATPDIPASRPAPPCPFGYVDQPARGSMLAHRLRGTTDGAALLAALGPSELRYCFGDGAHGVVMEDRVLLLDAQADVPEQAARLAHLLHHVVHGMPFPSRVPADAECDAIVETAIAREARAHAVEVRVRRGLGLVAPRYEFEDAFFRAPEEEREALVAEYLRAHPDGGPNLEALVSDYRARCERRRPRPRP